MSEPLNAPESYVFKARLPMTSDATPVFFRLKSRGLIHSGFNLSMKISIKLSKQSVLWRGLGEEKRGRREKYLLHYKVLFLNSPKTSRKLLYFDLKSEFITCAYVILLCILFLESISVSFTKFVAVSWSGKSDWDKWLSLPIQWRNLTRV